MCHSWSLNSWHQESGLSSLATRRWCPQERAQVWGSLAVESSFLLLSQLLSKGAFGYLLPIVSFVLAWLETWFLDFKVLPQEAEEERCESRGQGLGDLGFERVLSAPRNALV